MDRYDLIHKIDVAFSKVLRDTRKVCEIGNGRCGFETLQVSHIYSKGSTGLACRWNELNVMLLCNEHHRAWEVYDESKRDDILRKRLTEDQYHALQVSRSEIVKWSTSELELVLKTFTDLLRRNKQYAPPKK